MTAITEIAFTTLRSNDARLNGEITREALATIIKKIDTTLTTLGYTWDDVDAEIQRIINTGGHQ